MSSRVITYSSPFFLWKCKQTADFQFWFNFGKNTAEKQCGNMGIFQLVRIYVKSILANSRGPEMANLADFNAMNFDFSWMSGIENCKNSTKIKIQRLKNCQMLFFGTLEMTKTDFT